MEKEPTTLPYARTEGRAPFSYRTLAVCAVVGAVLGSGALLLMVTVGGVGAVPAGFVAMFIGIGLGSRNPTLRALFQYAGALGVAAGVPALLYDALSASPRNWMESLAREGIMVGCGTAGAGIAVVVFVAGVITRRDVWSS